MSSVVQSGSSSDIIGDLHAWDWISGHVARFPTEGIIAEFKELFDLPR
jgi:hypothetical protein